MQTRCVRCSRRRLMAAKPGLLLSTDVTFAGSSVRRSVVALLAAVATSVFVDRGVAQAGPATPPACLSDSTYHVLDFWLGSWNVVDSTGARLGSNRIERIVGG